MRNPSDNRLKLVSLFSGCGGLDLGFENAGFTRVWANDFDADAQAVYRKNLGEIDGRDILTVHEDEIPECDIMFFNFTTESKNDVERFYDIYDDSTCTNIC